MEANKESPSADKTVDESAITPEHETQVLKAFGIIKKAFQDKTDGQTTLKKELKRKTLKITTLERKVAALEENLKNLLDENKKLSERNQSLLSHIKLLQGNDLEKPCNVASSSLVKCPSEKVLTKSQHVLNIKLAKVVQDNERRLVKAKYVSRNPCVVNSVSASIAGVKQKPKEITDTRSLDFLEQCKRSASTKEDALEEMKAILGDRKDLLEVFEQFVAPSKRHAQIQGPYYLFVGNQLITVSCLIRFTNQCANNLKCQVDQESNIIQVHPMALPPQDVP
eukprot:TRINITY_DN64272_c0_g1_i1.p2 TRINITY_DN64272_c0_g1~~TRINITY_DN64272_c0_g1_i1.p2  ORF type:complete len:281 (-),score=31.36 TRINITY_DN64272_c0_g1_i1:3817-4659(-)